VTFLRNINNQKGTISESRKIPEKCKSEIDSVIYVSNKIGVTELLYLIDIFGTSIREAKNMSLLLGYLIGTNNTITYTFTQNNEEITEKWQIIIKQFSNFQPIEYQDIRRVGYTGTMQCIVNKIS